MANVSRSTIMVVVIVVVFLIINVILGVSIFFAATNLNQCVKFESNNCPVLMCNGVPGNNGPPNAADYPNAKDGSNPAFCWPYAYRAVGDSGSPDSYICNTPYPGRIAVVSGTGN